MTIINTTEPLSFNPSKFLEDLDNTITFYT